MDDSPDTERTTGKGEQQPPPDPKAVLQKLSEQKARETHKAQALTDDVKALETAIGELTKNRDAMEKADSEYAKADFPARISAVREYAKDKLPCVEALLGDELADAYQLIDELNAEVEQAVEEKKDADTAWEAATREVTAAKGELQAAEGSFKRLLDLPTALPDKVGKLEALKADFQKATDGEEPFKALAIGREIGREAKKLPAPAVNAYLGELTTAWRRLADAQQAARDREKAVADRRGDVERWGLRVEALTKDRVAELVRRWAARPMPAG